MRGVSPNSVSLLVIASGPRVGSSALSDILSKSGAGNVDEHFNPYKQMPEVLKKAGLKNLGEHFSYIVKNFSSNGVLAVKCHFDQFSYYLSRLDVLGAVDNVHYIHLTRACKKSQAVSYFIAKQTGAWKGKTDVEETKEAIESLDDMEFLSEITKCEHRIEVNDFYWEKFLEDKKSLSIEYESLIGGGGRRLQELESFLSSIYGKELDIDMQKSDFFTQRDSLLNGYILERWEFLCRKYSSYQPALMRAAVTANAGLYR